MKTYLVKLTPQEPYFFGNEKRFTIAGENNQGQMGNSYFIRSERTPLQTTLLGMMRYILMPDKDYVYVGKNEKAIGKESFDIECLAQDFGMIENISPLFLMKGEDKYVVTPFDCVNDKKKQSEKDDEENKKNYFYTPFKKYQEIETDSGKKWYATEFEVKEDIECSYVRLSDKKIVKAGDIFGTEVRTGNKKVTRRKKDEKTEEKGFFKKEYCYLKDGFIFAFYVTLSDESYLTRRKTQVFLGQGKSLFTLEFIGQEDTLKKEVAEILPENICYCIGDVYTMSEIYNCCAFSITRTRDYRRYITGENGKIQKGSVLYKLIKAGSVFIVSNKENFNEQIEKANCQKIGWNILVENKKQEGKS